MPSYGGYEFQSLQMDLLAFLVAIWESLDGDQFCFICLIVINFGRGFLRVYEFLNAIFYSFFEHLCSHLSFVSLVASLQPLHGTLGELK
jgi:hypothetical protein